MDRIKILYNCTGGVDPGTFMLVREDEYIRTIPKKLEACKKIAEIANLELIIGDNCINNMQILRLLQNSNIVTESGNVLTPEQISLMLKSRTNEYPALHEREARGRQPARELIEFFVYSISHEQINAGSSTRAINQLHPGINELCRSTCTNLKYIAKKYKGKDIEALRKQIF